MNRFLRFGWGTLLAVAVVASFAPGSVAQTAARPEIDSIFATWNTRDSPGCALGVYQNGRIAYERGYGMASLEHDVPITPETVFYVGSLSKQFTAAAAALAIQQGRLSADEKIRKYLPELPAYADGITVRHLVHHTSGLRDYNTLLSIAGRRGDEAFDNPTVLRITARQKKLNFEPGAEYLYSNTGYTLLALIVERATGVPFAEYANTRIFKPLDMSVTHYHTDETRLVKWRALAYEGRGSGFALDTPNNERAGAGGVFTNVRDLLRWDENFYDARVGGADLIKQLQVPGTLNGGRPLTYAWGLQVGTYRGLPMIEHGGSLGGYRAHLLRFPQQHISVAILCNLGSISPGSQARQVADAVITAAFTEPTPAPRASAGTAGGGPASAEPSRTNGSAPPPTDLTGKYYSDEVDATFAVDSKDGRLTLQREGDAEPAVLQAAGPDEYRFRGMTLRFIRGASRRVEALAVDAGRVRDIRFERR
jgi:CubicO group peptidase (beta-lactamase class C family)